MHRHIVTPETLETLRERRNGSSLRCLAAGLGLPSQWAAALSGVLRERPGALSFEGENVLRQALGLPVLAAPVLVIPCPDCGEAHTGRCYGKPVAEVAVLAPGEKIKRVRPDPPAWVMEATANLLRLRAQKVRP